MKIGLRKALWSGLLFCHLTQMTTAFHMALDSKWCHRTLLNARVSQQTQGIN